MTVRESLHFNYAGENSFDKGLINIATSSGLYDESIVGSRTTDEDRDINGHRYLKKIDEDVLEFPVSFYFEDKFNHEKIRETTRWLLQKTYQPLIFSNNPNRILYALATGDYRLIHNGLQEGYLTLNFRCNTSHAYTPFESSDIYDLSTNTSNGTVIDFINRGDLEVQPIIYIEKVEDGDVRINNLSDIGKEMRISNLKDGERVMINCEDYEIITDSDSNPYNHFNFNWLSLVYGINKLLVYGKCRIHYECRYKIY